MKTKKIISKLLTFIVPVLFLFSSCITTEQEYFINEDGSGKLKVAIKTPLEFNLNMGNQQGAEETTYEDSVKMIKGVNKIISKSEGIEAWKDIEYHTDSEGMLNFTGIAYFKDIKKINLGEIPTLPVTTFTKDKIEWVSGEELAGNLDNQRKMPEMEIDEGNIDMTVEKIQKQFQQSKMMMGMLLSAFRLEATYHLPYKIKNPRNLEKVNDFTVRQRLNGEKIFEQYEELIENEEKLKEIIANNDIKKFSLENPKLFKAAYPAGSMYSAQFKTGLFVKGPKSYFDYKKEVSNIKPKIPEFTIPEKSKKEAKSKVYMDNPSGFEPFWEKHTSKYTADIYKDQFAIYEKEKLKVFDITEKSLLTEIPVKKVSAYTVFLKWNPSGDKIAFVCQTRNKTNKGLIRIYSLENGGLLAEKYLDSQPFDFAWVDEKNFAVVGMRHELHFGKMEDNSITLHEKVMLSDEKMPQGAINPAKLGVLKMEKKGETYLLSFDKKSSALKLWNPYENKLLKTISIEKTGVPSYLVASPNPKYVALLLSDRVLIFQNGKLYKELNDIDTPLRKISWNPDGSKLVYINDQNYLIYYNVLNGNKKVIYDPDFKLQRFIMVNHTGQYGITQLTDSYVKYHFLKMNY